MGRRIWTQEQKLAVVLEMIKGGDSISAVCHRHGVAMNQAYRWRDAFLEGGRKGLLDRRNPQHRDPVREENRKLKELVGSQALVIEAQKKLAGMLAEDGKRLMVKRLVVEEGLSVKGALEVVDLTKSSYYYAARKRPARALDSGLIAAIEAILAANRGVYGYRKVARTLQAQGLRVNHKRVLRHLRAMGRLQMRKRKGIAWTRPSVVHPKASNTYWEMDTTTVWCGVDARRYLCGIIDAYDRGIPGSFFGDRCRADEAIATLEAALAQRFGGRVPENHMLTLRVDRGSQFVARRFRQAAAALGVTLEYAGIQCPDDKPYIESFFGKYKTEEVYRMDYASAIEGGTAWELYRRWYETERIHQSLGYRTPEQVIMSANHHLSPVLPCPV